MAFDSNFIDELKARINIVDVIGRDVKLKKAGSNYKGLCPFHKEKTPSFSVSETKQIYTCFGCGEKGDVISYVSKTGKLSFMEAVEKLCTDYGIEMPVGKSPKKDYDRLYEINRMAARFFFDRITDAKNEGYSYIRSRGISDGTIKKFGIGYAPAGWNNLSDYLISQEVTEEEMLELGLVVRGSKGIYDKFRNRVIFPIFSTSGKVIGFGGRALGDAMPKYLNSNESDVFLKKNNLYALNFTKKDISDADHVILVEGYMDVISLYQNGIKNVAASLGTALTENQGRLISRYTKNAVLSYDSDDAGVKAAERGIDVMRLAGCNVRILRIVDGKDPDEFIKKNGKTAFEKLVSEAIPGVDFKLDVMKKGFDLTDDLQTLEYIRRCVPVLKTLGPVEQNIYIKKLAEEFDISVMAIEAEVNSGFDQTHHERREVFRDSDRMRQKPTFDGEIRTELSLLVLAAYNHRYLKRFQTDDITFRTGIGSKIYKAMLEIADEGRPGKIEEDLKKIAETLDPEEESALNRAMDIIRIGPDDEAYYSECRSKYRLIRLKERKTELLNDLSIAEKLQNSEEIERIAAGLMELEGEIRKVRNN